VIGQFDAKVGEEGGDAAHPPLASHVFGDIPPKRRVWRQGVGNRKGRGRQITAS
jgi:hypothetical protein